MSKSSIVRTLAVSTVALVVLPATAHAQYLDPGAGSIILQAVIAAAIGTTALVKIYWRRISTFVSRWRKNSGEQ